jgi:hypothetical protein
MKRTNVYQREVIDDDMNEEDEHEVKMDCLNCEFDFAFSCDECGKEFKDGEEIFCTGDSQEHGEHYCEECGIGKGFDED